MTDEPTGTPRDSDEPDDHGPLDVDAEFARIVEAYGQEPPDTPVPEHPAPDSPEGLADRFRSYGWAEPPAPAEQQPDPLNTSATWEDEGHFVPPEPPPLGVPEPRRLLAWTGVLGAPLVMLVLVAVGVSIPGWLSFLLVAGFIGGFVFLVATMRRDDSGWPGDDGAVL